MLGIAFLVGGLVLGTGVLVNDVFKKIKNFRNLIKFNERRSIQYIVVSMNKWYRECRSDYDSIVNLVETTDVNYRLTPEQVILKFRGFERKHLNKGMDILNNLNEYLTQLYDDFALVPDGVIDVFKHVMINYTPVGTVINIGSYFVDKIKYTKVGKIVRSIYVKIVGIFTSSVYIEYKFRDTVKSFRLIYLMLNKSDINTNTLVNEVYSIYNWYIDLMGAGKYTDHINVDEIWENIPIMTQFTYYSFNPVFNSFKSSRRKIPFSDKYDNITEKVSVVHYEIMSNSMYRGYDISIDIYIFFILSFIVNLIRLSVVSTTRNAESLIKFNLKENLKQTPDEDRKINNILRLYNLYKPTAYVNFSNIKKHNIFD